MASEEQPRRPLLHQNESPNSVVVDAENNAVKTTKTRSCVACCCSCCSCCCKAIGVSLVIVVFILITVAAYPYVKETFYEFNADPAPSAAHGEWERKSIIEKVDSINSKNLTWKARYNPFGHAAPPEFMPYYDNKLRQALEDAKQQTESFFGAMKDAMMGEDKVADTVEHLRELLDANLTLPSSFDARDRWSKCASIHRIPNQGACGSCWAKSAAGVMSDRLCISTNYTRQEIISTEDLLSCCPTCGTCGGGGFLISSFSHWRDKGLVSGGDFGSNEGCKPYQIDSKCGYPCNIQYYTKDRTPKCKAQCQPLYAKSYEEDKIKSRKAYWLLVDPDGEISDWRVAETIKIADAMIPVFKGSKNKGKNRLEGMSEVLKRELYLHGPIMGCLTISEDFIHYASGIYKTEERNYFTMYSHCMRLIGWGEEGGVKYWTYANSWGRNWGDHGFIKVHESMYPPDAAAGIY